MSTPASPSSPSSPSAAAAADPPPSPRRLRPASWIAMAAIAGGLAGAVTGQAARSWRIGPPVLIEQVDREEVAAVNRRGEGPYDGARRELVVVPLRQSFAALERVATDLGEPLIADVARDGLDVVHDLRNAETDPVIASRVELLRLRELIAAVETDVDTIVQTPTDAATLRLVRATVADARLRAAQARVLVARFGDQVVVQKGDGGNRPAAAAPLELIEQLLVRIDATLASRHEAILEARTDAWRAEMRTLLGVLPAP